MGLGVGVEAACSLPGLFSRGHPSSASSSGSASVVLAPLTGLSAQTRTALYFLCRCLCFVSLGSTTHGWGKGGCSLDPPRESSR